eukprot:TRINITY_DN2339_c1_g1_i1.p1 TRINITY_DN2339_c1_g1~~TRINITY_DN2339_c1_g1_i1.p1  ORF type:complete len:535 (+),score=185.61 TRINITY_DN2339_c1_g1_i1:65-1669(+)
MSSDDEIEVAVPHATDDLAALVQQQKEEIDRLRGLVTGAGEGAVEHKYLDALRRNKALKVKLDAERARADRSQQLLDAAERRVIEAERIVAQSSLPAPPSTRAATHADTHCSGDDDGAATRKELREVKVSLDRAQRLNADLRRQLSVAKQESQRCRDVLRKEVGDGADQLLDNPEDGHEGWRGRAQQISILRSKLKDLQRQLQQQDGVSVAASDARSVAASTTAATSRDFDEQHRRALESAAAGRRAKEAALQKQIAEQERAAKEQRERADAAHARLEVLERTQGQMRVQVQRMVAKAENDDRLIDAYKEEMERLQKEGRQRRQQQQPQGSGGPQQQQPPAGAEPADFYRQRAADLERDLRDAAAAVESSRAELREARAASLAVDVDRDTTGAVPWREEREKMREYIGILRADLQASHADAQQAKARALAAEAGQRKIPPAGFDPAQLPPALVERFNMLKGENASLKERLDLLQLSMERDAEVWNQVSQCAHAGDDSAESTAQLEQELHDLRAQHSELKRAYNSEMQRRLREGC